MRVVARRRVDEVAKRLASQRAVILERDLVSDLDGVVPEEQQRDRVRVCVGVRALVYNRNV
jgi:hypothetical protein